jgi:hypothetical protein
LVASVANASGNDGEQRDADLDVTAFNPCTGTAVTSTLANIPTHDRGDDHNVAALWQRPDGRYLAVYTGHQYGLGISRKINPPDRYPDTFSVVPFVQTMPVPGAMSAPSVGQPTTR